MLYLLILFGFLNAADAYTTWNVFRFGGFERPWTVMAKLIKHMGLYRALLVMKAGAVLAVWLVSYFYPFDWRILAGIDAAYALQVYWNFLQLQKHKEK